MRNLGIRALALASAALVGTAAGQERTLTVRVYDYAGTPDAEWRAASLLAHDVLLRAGVETVWILCHPGVMTSQPVGSGEIFLRLLPRSMERDYMPYSALGHTLLPGHNRPGSQIYVFHDRTVDCARDYGVSTARLLGYAMAHELGHAIIGTAGHAQCGVMRAKWNRADLQDIEARRLSFSCRRLKCATP